MIHVVIKEKNLALQPMYDPRINRIIHWL